jgi:hypothetical protein
MPTQPATMAASDDGGGGGGSRRAAEGRLRAEWQLEVNMRALEHAVPAMIRPAPNPLRCSGHASTKGARRQEADDYARREQEERDRLFAEELQRPRTRLEEDGQLAAALQNTADDQLAVALRDSRNQNTTDDQLAVAIALSLSELSAS